MPKTRELTSDIAGQHQQYLKNQPTALRRCLSCEAWMRSTGADHRICNRCKGIPSHLEGHVGARVWPTRGRSSKGSGA